MPPMQAPLCAGLVALAAIAGVAAPSAARAEPATNPLAKLLAKPGNDYLCFRRDYDEAHLKRHPGQITTSVLLSLAPSKDNAGQSVWVKLQLRQRPYQKGQETLANMGASCEWSITANRDTSGNRMIRTYPREDGFVCLAMYNNTAAEEAGTLLLDLARNGRTATVHLDPAGIGLWGTLPEHATPDEKAAAGTKGHPPLKPGVQDRVFRLTRADPAECGAMEKAIDLKY
jgi:hypothetical protein